MAMGLCFLANVVWAGADGTSGAQFLKIGAGARPVGMGAYTGIADDVNAAAWNPAGLSKLESAQFTAMHAQWLRGTDYEFVAAATPSSWGTFGISFISLSVDDMERRSTDTDAPDGVFESNDTAYALSYSRAIGDTWHAGANLRFIRQKIYGNSASAIAGDIGALWQTPHKPLDLGLAIRHFGTEPKFVDESDPLPLTMALGAGYTLLSDSLLLGLDVRKPNDNDMQIGFGAEYTQTLYSDLSGSLRAGYNSAGTDPTDGNGISIGMGLAWREWGFDMAWAPYGVLGNTFRYSFLVKF